MKRLFALCLFLASFLLCAGSARADMFAEPTRENIYHALIRFGAINIYQDDFIDNYLMLTECDLFKGFFRDDFKWQKIRLAARQKIKQDVGVYPVAFRFDTELQMGRYDFKENIYRFSEKTTVRNANAFVIFKGYPLHCGSVNSNIIPDTFRVVLDHSVYIDGLPLGVPDANALQQRMDAAKNTDRLVYTRFNLRLSFVALLSRGDNELGYRQANQYGADGSNVRIDARLDSVDFYEDPERTKLIYSYREGNF